MATVNAPSQNLKKAGEEKRMCVVEIHAEQETAEAMQALAHNLHTVLSDATMVQAILEQRDPEIAKQFSQLKGTLESASADAWSYWQEYVPACLLEGPHEHEHEHSH